MLRQLKIRFIMLAMLAMTATLVLAFTTANITLRVRLSARIDSVIDVLYENGGAFPIITQFDWNTGLHNETPFETRYYVAYVSNERAIIGADYSHIAINNIEGVSNQINTILSSGKERGYVDRCRYGCFDSELGKMIIVVDCTTDLSTVDTLLMITLATIIGCVVAVLLILMIASNRILKPFEENREKQKRFITDAGHELKTPIAIIQSNAEVMEMIDGENKWLTNIKSQTARMSKLVKEMIELSKLDEQVLSEKEKQRIVLSEIVYNSVESFRVPAEAKGIKLNTEIASNVSAMGDLEDIVRLVGILIDNAIKYTDDRKEISVKLFQKSKKAFIVVENTCAGLDKASVRKFFDRFYRGDSSRNSEIGGYGIGLSMAQMIVQNHKGKLTVAYSEDERIIFTAEL